MPVLADIAKYINPDDPSLSGVLPTGAIIAGGVLNNNAAGDTANTIAGGTEQAQGTIAQAGGTLSDLRTGYDPYRQAGEEALGQYSAGAKPGGGLTDPFTYDWANPIKDPSYNFALTEGQKGINTEAAARGLYNSGGTLKALNQYNVDTTNKYLSQDYARAENTFRQNQATRTAALRDLTNTGLTATGQQETSGRQGIEWTATQLADLQQQKADAIAAGDLGKAKAIGDTISGIVNEVGGNQTLAALKKIFPQTAVTAGQTIPGLTGAAAQGLSALPSAAEAAGAIPAAGISPTLPEVSSIAAESAIPGTAGIGALGSIGAIGTTIPGLAGTAAQGLTALPSIASAVGAAGPVAGAISETLPEVAAVAGESAIPGTAGGGAFGSIGSAIQSAASGAVNGLQAVGGFLMSNPITIVAGVAALATAAILKSQAHWEANTLIKDVQQPFGENLGKIVNNFNDAMASGQLDRASAQALRDSTQALITNFNNKVYEFAQGGDDKKEAALNAMRTMAEDFGAREDYPNLPSYSKILGGMDAQIAQLPEAA